MKGLGSQNPCLEAGFVSVHLERARFAGPAYTDRTYQRSVCKSVFHVIILKERSVFYRNHNT